MKRAAFVMIAAIMIFTVKISAQSGDDFVRQSTTPPDIFDTGQGWEHDLSRDSYTNGYGTEFYGNKKENLDAYLYVYLKSDGTKQEYLMLYGTSKVARSAIKIGSKWHVARELAFDNGKLYKENLPKINRDIDKIVISLDTLDGIKELVIIK